MKIREIYQKFGVPPNLAEHMLRVAGVARFICRCWKEKTAPDEKTVLRVALLHDLGNIVRFDFENHPEFLGKEQKNAGYWKKIQAKTIQKYGKDDHEATKKMLTELGIDKNSQETILNKSFGNSKEVRDSNNWILKIIYYADLRVLPLGIGSLKERLADIKNRIPKYAERTDFEDLVSACREVEKQLQTKAVFSKEEINDKNIPLDRQLLEFGLES